MGIFDFLKSRPAVYGDDDNRMKMIAPFIFPRGKRQIKEEAKQLSVLLQGKLTMQEAQNLLCKTKALLFIAKGDTETSIKNSVLKSTNGRLTETEACMVYNFLTGVFGSLVTGGDGTSKAQAIVINASSSAVGLLEEYTYIERICGKKNEFYEIERQSKKKEGSRHYDIINIRIRDGTKRKFWFDITSFAEKE